MPQSQLFLHCLSFYGWVHYYHQWLQDTQKLAPSKDIFLWFEKYRTLQHNHHPYWKGRRHPQGKQKGKDWNPMLPSNIPINFPIPIPYLRTHTVKIKPLGRNKDSLGHMVRTQVVQLGSWIIFPRGPWELFPCSGITVFGQKNTRAATWLVTAEGKTFGEPCCSQQTPKNNEKTHLKSAITGTWHTISSHIEFHA